MGFLNNIGDAINDGLGLGVFNNGSGGDEFRVLKANYMDSETLEPNAFIESGNPVPGSFSLFNLRTRSGLFRGVSGTISGVQL